MFKLLFTFQGRINRAKYWLALLIYAIVWGVSGFAFGAALLFSESVLAIVALYVVFVLAVWLPIVISGIAVASKRLHDRAKTGWWLLLYWGTPFAVVAIGTSVIDLSESDELEAQVKMIGGFLIVAIFAWIMVEFGCLRGTAGANDYGPDPLEPAPSRPPVEP